MSKIVIFMLPVTFSGVATKQRYSYCEGYVNRNIIVRLHPKLMTQTVVTYLGRYGQFCSILLLFIISINHC